MIGPAAIGHVWMSGVAGLSQAATGSLVAAVWQGVLLAAVVGLGLRLLPKTPAAVRFAIWFGVFLMVTALPVISLWPRAAAPGSHVPWFTVDARWSLAIAAVWAMASLVRAGTLVAAALRVRALWKRATPVELEALHPIHRDDAAMIGAPGICRRAQICTSDEVDRPTVIGFFSPKILIPSWLLERLTPAEQEQVVLHEVGHLGRADDWMNLLQKIALVIFPLNPALAWVERQLCFERELAVDERVLQAFAGKAGAAKAYAACLATLAEYRLGRRALALALGALGRESHPSKQAGWGPRSELGRRVGRILRREAGMKPLHSRLVLGGAMLGLVVAATGFERCPQVVGFANHGSETVANETQGQPTHGGGTAISRTPGLVAMIDGRQVRAFSAMYKPPEKRQIAPSSHVEDQVMALGSNASIRQAASGDSLKAERQPTLRDTAANDGPPNFVKGPPELAGGSPRFVEAEWVVVTAWQNGQATRMVFTAAGTEEQPQTVTDPGAAAGGQVVPVESGARYAAVPVRGGWLVFQL